MYVELGHTLKGEHKLRIFENNVLTRISGPRRERVRGGWGKLRNDELHVLYSLPHILYAICWRLVYRLLLAFFFVSPSDNFFLLGGGVRLSPLFTSATVWPIVPAADDDG
jgi:hypothetical protein